MVTETALTDFLSRLNGMVAAYHSKHYPNQTAPVIEAMTGPRYIRLVSVDASSRSAYGFIDIATGDLLKSASWKAPAKGKRGNIFAADPLSGCTPHGMQYAYR